MDEEQKKRLDDLFAQDVEKDQEKYLKNDELNEKYEKIIVPIFKEYADYYKTQGISVIPKNPTNFAIHRNSVEFYITCTKSSVEVLLVYAFVGAGLERNTPLSIEKITEETIQKFFQDFTEYMLKES